MRFRDSRAMAVIEADFRHFSSFAEIKPGVNLISELPAMRLIANAGGTHGNIMTLSVA